VAVSAAEHHRGVRGGIVWLALGSANIMTSALIAVA